MHLRQQRAGLGQFQQLLQGCTQLGLALPGQRRAWAGAGEAVAEDRLVGADARARRHVPFVGFHHGQGALGRGFGGQLDRGHEIALVLFRQEAARHAGEQEAAQRGQHHEQDHPARRVAHRRGDVAQIGVADLGVVLVEGAVDDVRVVVVRRLEEGRAQRRGEAQGQERRERHRDGDGQRELLVDLTCRAALQGGRDEHRGQHHGDRHHRAGDLGHRLLRGRLRRQAFLGHDALDVLDHHDRVVDHDADRQHHREQGQLVDREADHPHAQEGAEQGHRDDQGRDQGGAEVLQEDQHHQEHQQHRFEQGLDHFLDRDLDEGGAVVRREPGHAGREAGLQLVHLAAHRFGNVQGVGARQQLDGEGAGRLAVVLARASRQRWRAG
ncbi:hypothetical protein G6F57_015371 [Rhizopus arrhizus]|nr:hypothetical protein G6F57_015371 [Rhizopus arrhizus]